MSPLNVEVVMAVLQGGVTFQHLIVTAYQTTFGAKGAPALNVATDPVTIRVWDCGVTDVP